MLEGDDLLLPRVVIWILVDRRLENLLHPRQANGVVDLDLRREVGAVIKGADGDLEPTRLAIGQRRAAARAEAAIDVDRGLEIARLLVGPFDAVLRNGDQRAEEGTELLLAHAAVADGGASKRTLDAETHGATLAAAGSDGLGHDLSSGGHWSVS